MVKKSLSIQQQTVPSCSSSNLARLLLDIVFISTTIFSFFTPPIIMSSSLILQRTFGKSTLSRQVPFDQAWNAPPWQEADNDNDNDNDTETEPSKQEPTPRFCCLIYATQNGWKLPILFEEMGVQYDWCLVDFEINQQKSAEFLKINPNGRIPALIDRHKNVTVAESGAILEYICEEAESKLLPSKEDDLQMHLTCKQWVSRISLLLLFFHVEWDYDFDLFEYFEFIGSIWVRHYTYNHDNMVCPQSECW